MSSQKKIVREGYDKLSYDYRSDETEDDYGAYSEWIDILRQHLPAGAPVLDLGCGCGLPATKLLAETFDVTGVDFSPVQIQRAEQFLPGANFICADISNVDLPDEQFAAVVSFYTIIHMPLDEHRGLFEKCADWLRPRGYLMFIVGHDAWTGTEENYLGVDGGKMCWSHADEDTYESWITASGFHIQWKRFIPEGESGHTLVFARKSPDDRRI